MAWMQPLKGKKEKAMLLKKCETGHEIHIGFPSVSVLYSYFQKLSTVEMFGYVELCTGSQETQGQLLDKKSRCGIAEHMGILSLNSGSLCLVRGRHLINIYAGKKK